MFGEHSRPLSSESMFGTRPNLYSMRESLGYDHIDKATLRDNLYVPQGYKDREEQFRQIRTSMLQVLRGEHPVPVTMVGPVQVEESLQAIKELPLSQQPVLLPPPGTA